MVRETTEQDHYTIHANMHLLAKMRPTHEILLTSFL